MGMLVKFQKDYADEFDVFGYRVMTNTELKEYLDKAEKANYPVEIGFGSNETLDFHDFNDLVDSLEITDISDVYLVIKNVMGTSFGWFPEDVG